MQWIAMRIRDTQREVTLFESGKITEDQFTAGLSVESFPAGSIAEVLVEVYATVRKVEALAYKCRQQGRQDLEHLCESLRRVFAPALEKMKGELPSAKNELEMLGTIWIAEKILWALRVIEESFAQWGY
jgi:hypothetical protein